MSHDEEKADERPEESQAQREPESTRMYPPPANFRLFLESLLSQAWVALGKFPNPMTGESQFDEAWARYYIDMVGILEDKTQGNLDKDEEKLLEVNLSSLRLTFIQEQKGQDAPQVTEDSVTEDSVTEEASGSDATED